MIDAQFKNFLYWLTAHLGKHKRTVSLGDKTTFNAKIDDNGKCLFIEFGSRGKSGKLSFDKLKMIWERYISLGNRKNLSSEYTDPSWPETPNRILAPYAATLIRDFEMALDQSVIERNRASTDRIRALFTCASDEELQFPVGEDWTVAIALAHLAFWDKRVINILENTVHEDKLVVPEIDIAVNDISLLFWAAIPPREAARMALETAKDLDERLANLPSALFEEIKARNERWVLRALHRNQHLDQIDAALKK